jgi:hypothetical protein
MLTIPIHKSRLLEASFKYQQQALREIMLEQERRIDAVAEMSSEYIESLTTQ